jgi:hypothetical protein
MINQIPTALHGIGYIFAYLWHVQVVYWEGEDAMCTGLWSTGVQSGSLCNKRKWSYNATCVPTAIKENDEEK